MKKIEWYEEFVDLGRKPGKDELLALYYFEPEGGINWKEAAGRIASESSVGTWTTLAKLPPRIKKLKAVAYRREGNFLMVSYPLDLWEPGSVPQLMSGIGGNIFGMKAVKNLRLVDVMLPEKYMGGFKGPQLGIQGVRKIFGRKRGPLTATVPKPKLGFSAKEHAEIGFEAWMGGLDLVKDDENLTSQKFNRFEERVRLMTKMRDRAEKLTGEKKSALINITGETREMEGRAKMLHEYGWDYAMVDVVTTGFSGMQTAREFCGDYKLAIHAHRAMHAMFDRNPKHGMTMLMLAKLMRLIGVDQIHTGTIIGKLEGTKEGVLSVVEECRKQRVKGKKNISLDQEWGRIKPVLPVSSGGLHPGLVPQIMHTFGEDVVIQLGGGIHGHPDGTRAGAKALMQSIEATMEGIGLDEYSRNNYELKKALDKWGYIKPK